MDKIFKILLSLFLFSCVEVKDEKCSGFDVIPVDLARRDKVSVKDLFSDIQVIPLETTQESLIRELTQIKSFEDRLYVHDYSKASIFVFDKEGSFLWKLAEKGNGPRNYLTLSDFDLDVSRRNLVTLCPVSNALFFYDLRGGFLGKKRLPELSAAYHSFQFQNEDTIAFFTYDYDKRLKFYSLSKNKMINECFPEEQKDVFCRSVFPFPHALRRSLTNKVYSLTDATLAELYRWDFGDLNNNLNALEFPSGRNQREKIQFIKDVYSSKVVNYVIDLQGQNNRYRYAMVVRENKYIHCFYDRRTHDLLQFEQTLEGLRLYPIYFGEEFMLCVSGGEFSLDELLPKMIRTEAQQRVIDSLTEEDNPVLIKYVFNDKE